MRKKLFDQRRCRDGTPLLGINQLVIKPETRRLPLRGAQDLFHRSRTGHTITHYHQSPLV